MALSIAAEAGRLVRRDASSHVAALKLLVRIYIEDRKTPNLVDWDFIISRTMKDKSIWKIEDEDRHKMAWTALGKEGHVPQEELIPDGE
jgi:hypothetical protein